MPTALAYAYPWDFEGAPAAERAAELGVSAVAVAASYHATRAAGPLHPSRPLVEVEHAACYVPVRPSAWAGHRLVPSTPTWVAGTDSFGTARTALTRAGLGTHAWVVLTHNSALGRSHPDLVVRNAFGDRYSYALCPSAEDVVAYCTTLVEQVLAAGPVDGLVLEACGPMGFDHNGLHEKTALAGWDGTQRRLLSLCFCAACVDRCTAAGLDVDDLRRRVHTAVSAAQQPPASVEDALGTELAAAVADVRRAATSDLRRQVLSAARTQPQVRVTLHADPDPWSTGSFAPVPASLPEPVDALVASCFDLDAGTTALTALRRSAGTAALGALVRPSDRADDEVVARVRAAGADELHLYHLGLVGPAGHARLQRLTAAFLD